MSDTPRTDDLVKCAPGSEWDNLATPTKPLIELCRKLERALIEIRDECFSGSAHDIAERALNEAAPQDKTLLGVCPSPAVAARCVKCGGCATPNMPASCDCKWGPQDIPSVIRRSTWKTPELRESAAKLVEAILNG